MYMHPRSIFCFTGASSRPKRDVLTTGVVAFHAVLGGAETANLGIHQNIPFPLELLNIGDSYENAHHRFIASISGVYVFSVTLLSYNHFPSSVVGNLVKNEAVLARVLAEGDEGRHDQGSVTVTVLLQDGDQVWDIRGPENASIYGDHYTSFTGFLLAQM